MSALPIAPPGSAAPGFRLHRIELLDWGRFEGGPHVFSLNGESALLTGASDAARSAWVDALMTLIAPVAERASDDRVVPSVVLAVFRDASTQDTVALAHIGWHHPDADGASSSYVCAERDLAIAEHFGVAGLERQVLVARLRGLGARVEAAFAPYAAWMRRFLGLRDRHALSAIWRMGSMRTLDDLDAVVRRQILEPFDVASHLNGLFATYEATHEVSQALGSARAAVNDLETVTRALDGFRDATRNVEALRAAHDELPVHFAQQKRALIEKQIACMLRIREQLDSQIERLERRLVERRSQANELRVALARNGGDRLERLSIEIRRLVGMRDLRRAKAERYADLVRRLGEEMPADEAQYHAQRRRLQRMREEAREREAYLARALPEHGLHLQRVSEQLDALPADIESLRDRVQQLGVRVAAITQLIEREQGQRRTLGERLEVLARVEEFASFEELDWSAVAGEIAERMEERERLEASADVLRSLSQQLQRVEQEIVRSERELDTAKDRRSRIEQREHDADLVRRQLETRLVHVSATRDAGAMSAVAEQLVSMRSRVPGGDAPTLETCDAIEADTRTALLQTMQAEEDACRAARDTLVQAMAGFRAAHPEHGDGIEGGVEAAERYAERLEYLRGQVVPALETTLRRCVEGALCDELASLEAALAHGRFRVREQIARLNQALSAIRAGAGDPVIALQATPRTDDDVRAFHDELRRCIEAIRSGARGAEASIERVGALIDAVRATSQASIEARRRRARLLDVRHAFRYSAVTAGRGSGDAEQSGPASLAHGTEICAVLVADLHRRLGFNANVADPPSLRFTVVGAGVMRGADERLRYTLGLLRRLGLQVLVAVPLDKVEALEPFVQVAGLVHQTEGAAPALQTLTIDARG